MYSKITPIFK